jgi:hypothetical protein
MSALKQIYLLYQYDIYFTKSSAVLFGAFSSLKLATEAVHINFDKKEGVDCELYSNGDNQWKSDKFEFGVAIVEVELIGGGTR